MNIINLTSHAVVVCGTTYPPSGKVARVSTIETVIDTLGEVPVVSVTYGECIDLPASADDTVYIVSGMVRSALGSTRPDVYAPDTGATAIRNDKGQIVGVARLIGVR